MKREDPMEAKRKHIIYKEEFRRQAVEMVIHSGKTQAQVAHELGSSEYSLNLWKKAYLRQQAPAQIDGQQRSPEQMGAEIRRLQKENEYLKRVEAQRPPSTWSRRAFLCRRMIPRCT